MATEQDIVAKFKNAQDALVIQASDLSLASIANMVKAAQLMFSRFSSDVNAGMCASSQR